jgi:hypothetical protein
MGFWGPSGARLRAWRTAAEACGVGRLTPTMNGSSQTGWTGRRRSITVTLSSSFAGWPHRGTHVMVEGVSNGLVLIPTEGPYTARKRVRTLDDLELGDPVFDGRIVLPGAGARGAQRVDAPMGVGRAQRAAAALGVAEPLAGGRIG